MTRKGAAVVRLADDLRIAQARSTYESIVAGAQRTAVTLDAARVTRVDAAGLQALVAAIARLDAAEVRLEWQHVPEALANGASLAGLTEALRLP